MIKTIRCILPFVLMCLTVSCGENPAETLIAGYITISVTPAGPLTGTVGQPSDTLFIRVGDSNGKPTPNVTVLFAVFDAASQVIFIDNKTNDKGELRAQWVFDKKAGHQEIAIRVDDRRGDPQLKYIAAEVLPEVAQNVTLTPFAGTLVAGNKFRIANKTVDRYNNEIWTATWQWGTSLPRRTVNWTTSNTAIATVEPIGEVTLKRSGPVTITAQVENALGSTQLNVVGGSDFSQTYGHYCFVTEDRRGVCGGDNYTGQLGIGSTNQDVGPWFVKGNLQFSTIQAGRDVSCGLTTSADLWCWGRYGISNFKTEPTQFAQGMKFMSISTGDFEFCGVTVSNELYCWFDMNNTRSETPFRMLAGMNVTDVSVGSNRTCAIADAINIYCWTQSQPNPVRLDTDVRLIKLGVTENHACGLTFDGVAYCWGADSQGQLGNGPGAPDRCGFGSAECSNKPIPLATSERFKEIVAVAAATCGLTLNNEVICWGEGTQTPTKVANSEKYLAIRPGPGLCGITEGHAVVCHVNSVASGLGNIKN